LASARRGGSGPRAVRAGCAAAALAGLLAPAAAGAHERVDGVVPTLATAWSLSPWLLLPLAVLVALHALGLVRLWRRAGVGRGITLLEAAAFAGGVLVLLLATTWPLDALGEWSLAAHMAQHMLLLAVVPPLLLAGRPLATAAHALPPRWAQRLHAATAAATARTALALTAASIAHGLVMWGWHAPAATSAALAHDGVHWAMHGSFLAAGLWFWAALWRRVRDPDTGAGAGVVALVAVMMQMGLLGGLLTFATRPLFADYVRRAPRLGLEPLADQQLAGLIMWVPSCVPYLVGALLLLSRGFQRFARDGDATSPAAPSRVHARVTRPD
jgi:putative membrane protein